MRWTFIFWAVILAPSCGKGSSGSVPGVVTLQDARAAADEVAAKCARAGIPLAYTCIEIGGSEIWAHAETRELVSGQRAQARHSRLSRFRWVPFHGTGESHFAFDVEIIGTGGRRDSDWTVWVIDGKYEWSPSVFYY